MTALDGPLSRRAQAMLRDPSALVLRLMDAADVAAYYLDRAGQERLLIGRTGGEAHTALVALRARARVGRSREEPTL